MTNYNIITDKEVALAAVSQYAYAIKDVSADIEGYKEVALAAVSKSWMTITDISDAMRGDKDIKLCSSLQVSNLDSDDIQILGIEVFFDSVVRGIITVKNNLSKVKEISGGVKTDISHHIPLDEMCLMSLLMANGEQDVALAVRMSKMIHDPYHHPYAISWNRYVDHGLAAPSDQDNEFVMLGEGYHGSESF